MMKSLTSAIMFRAKHKLAITMYDPLYQWNFYYLVP
jgi:hypothetical protein